MKKKVTTLFLLLASVMLLAGTLPPRVTVLTGKKEKIKTFEIVVEKSTPLLKFTASELQTFLQKSTGVKPALVNKPSGRAFALILGDNSFARKAGIDVKKLPAEGYYMIRKGNALFLAGQDDAVQTPVSNRWQQVYKRGSLSAAYDFLERFASARFFFGGPYGTVIPAKGFVELPATIRIMERPDMSHRNYYHGNAALYPTYRTGKNDPHGDTLTRVRLRFSENLVEYGHGQCHLDLIQRFGKRHPEYFALMADGRRCMEKDIPHTGHLCYNSGVLEELYQDAKAFLTGKEASTRGIRNWRGHNRTAKCFNIMPQDWLYWCGCEKCKKIAEPGRGKIYSDPKHSQAVSNHIWKITGDVARRLKKEGVKGSICQMAYNPYKQLPDCDLPSNVKVMVATKGTGADKADTDILRAWKKKCGGVKPVVWTYFIGKHMSKKIDGIPPMAPRAIGDFLEVNKDLIDGGFFESETDYVLSQYLNYYVLAKKAWNTSLNTDALLEDHHRAMFGKGAPFMKQFYEKLEDVWCKKILGNVVDTGLGPVVKVPTDFQIWTQIFSPEQMKKFHALFDKALRAASADKAAVSRINFIRQNLLGPLEKEVKKFNDAQRAVDFWVLNCPGSVYLRPYKGEVNEVSTKVTVARTAAELIFTFDCEEPRMKDLKAVQTVRDHALTFDDSEVEVFINPSGDRKNYFHFLVNTNGAITDYKCAGKADRSWNSAAKATVVKKPASWSATLRIPLKDLGKLNPAGVPVNFARHRALKGKKVKEIYYQWSPLPGKRGGFHAIHNWGVLREASAQKQYLLMEDFSGKRIKGLWMSGGKKGGQMAKLDKNVFMSAGQSLYYKNVKNARISCGFYLPGMKSNTRYRLSYYLKTNDLKGRGGAGAFIYFNKTNGRGYPQIQELGTTPWHRLSFEFKTPADTGKGRVPILGLWIWNAEGEAYFDNVCIEEIK